MACRIGITTNLEEGKQYWQNKCDGFANWQVLAGPLSKEEAQKKETELAQKYGCEAHPGGDDPDSDDGWYVYYFTCLQKKNRLLGITRTVLVINSNI